MHNPDGLPSQPGGQLNIVVNHQHGPHKKKTVTSFTNITLDVVPWLVFSVLS